MYRFDTPGRVAFRAWLKEHSITYEEAASKLEVTVSAVGNWCAGSHRPDLVLRKVIEVWTGISRGLWLTEAESERIQSLLNRLDQETK